MFPLDTFVSARLEASHVGRGEERRAQLNEKGGAGGTPV